MSDPASATLAITGFFVVVALILSFIPAMIGRSIGVALLNLLVLPLAFVPLAAVVFWFVCLFAAFMTRNRVERNRQHRELVRLAQEQRATAS